MLRKLVFILVLVLMLPVGMRAEILWKGYCVFSNYSSDDGRPVIAAAKLKAMEAGDTLVVTLTENNNDEQTWHTVQLWTPDFATCICDGGQLTADARQFAFIIDSALGEKLRATGFTLGGTGYIASRIALQKKVIPAPTFPDVETPVTAAGLRQELYGVSSEIIANPERGFLHHVELHPGSNSNLSLAEVRSYREKGVTLFLLSVNLSECRTSAQIPEALMARLRGNLAILRRGGAKCVLRFAYSYMFPGDDGRGHYWEQDATPEIVLAHIAQISREIFADNSDVIAVMEAGFVGTWGEWYYSDNFGFQPKTEADYASRRQVVEALLAALPPSRCVSVRYPAAKMKMYGLTAADTIRSDNAFNGSILSRIGFHNDCFLADNTDMGTFAGNSVDDRTFMAADTRFTPMGGETCTAPNRFTTPANTASNIYTYHWSYLNEDYHQDCLNEWKDNGTMDLLARELGYRFALHGAWFTPDAEAAPGRPFHIVLSIQNYGAAAPFNPHRAEIVMINTTNGARFTYPLSSDPRRWASKALSVVDESFTLNANMAPGEYAVFLNLPDPEEKLADNPLYSIRLANADVWDESNGYNRLTTVQLSTGTSVPGVQQSNGEPANNQVYDISGRMVNPDSLSSGIYVRNGTKILYTSH